VTTTFEPFAEPEGPITIDDANGLPMGHGMSFIFPYIYQPEVIDRSCALKPKINKMSSTTAMTSTTTTITTEDIITARGQTNIMFNNILFCLTLYFIP